LSPSFIQLIYSALVKPGALVIVDDCEADINYKTSDEVRGIAGVSDAWRHAVAKGIVKPFPDTCHHVGLCLGRYA
jgi:ribosomal protein S9